MQPNFCPLRQNTDKHLVEGTRWLKEKTANQEHIDIAGGSSSHTDGGIDLNPAAIEYLMRQYIGGPYSSFERVKKTVETIEGDRDFEWRNVPYLNRLVTEGDERTANRKLRNEYFEYRRKAELTKKQLKDFEKKSKEQGGRR